MALGGRTAEVTYDNSGNVIQQEYDRSGNMIGVYDEKGVQLKETEYNSDGHITAEKIYENGRLVKEAEYEPYMINDGGSFVAEHTEMFEFRYAPDSTEVEIVLSITDGELTATDSVVYHMQSPDNYITRGSYGSSGSEKIGKLEAYIYSVNEVGSDYEIETKYDGNGKVTRIEDSRDRDE